MKAVASRVTEKSDVLLLQPVDMDDSGPYEIAEPRVISALETYTPSCELTRQSFPVFNSQLTPIYRASNSQVKAAGGDSVCPGHRSAREDGSRRI
jgi:myosin V